MSDQSSPSPNSCLLFPNNHVHFKSMSSTNLQSFTAKCNRLFLIEFAFLHSKLLEFVNALSFFYCMQDLDWKWRHSPKGSKGDYVNSSKFIELVIIFVTPLLQFVLPDSLLLYCHALLDVNDDWKLCRPFSMVTYSSVVICFCLGIKFG